MNEIGFRHRKTSLGLGHTASFGNNGRRVCICLQRGSFATESLERAIQTINKVVFEHEQKKQRQKAAGGSGAVTVEVETMSKPVTFKASARSEKLVQEPADEASRSLAAYLALPLDQYSLLDPGWIARQPGCDDRFTLRVPLFELVGLELQPQLSVRVDSDPRNAQVHFHADQFRVGDPRFDEDFKLAMRATLRHRPVPTLRPFRAVRQMWSRTRGAGRQQQAAGAVGEAAHGSDLSLSSSGSSSDDEGGLGAPAAEQAQRGGSGAVSAGAAAGRGRTRGAAVEAYVAEDPAAVLDVGVAYGAQAGGGGSGRGAGGRAGPPLPPHVRVVEVEVQSAAAAAAAKSGALGSGAAAAVPRGLHASTSRQAGWSEGGGVGSSHDSSGSAAESYSNGNGCSGSGGSSNGNGGGEAASADARGARGPAGPGTTTGAPRAAAPSAAHGRPESNHASQNGSAAAAEIPAFSNGQHPSSFVHDSVLYVSADQWGRPAGSAAHPGAGTGAAAAAATAVPTATSPHSQARAAEAPAVAAPTAAHPAAPGATGPGAAGMPSPPSTSPNAPSPPSSPAPAPAPAWTDPAATLGAATTAAPGHSAHSPAPPADELPTTPHNNGTSYSDAVAMSASDASSAGAGGPEPGSPPPSSPAASTGPTCLLVGSVDVAVTVGVPAALAAVPRPLLGMTASLIARYAIASLLPSFLDLLAADYGRWSSGQSVAARAAPSGDLAAVAVREGARVREAAQGQGLEQGPEGSAGA